MSDPLGSLIEPGAKQAIDDIAAGGADMLLMMVRGFQTAAEAVLLMHMLWYAHDQGVTVLFVPNKEDKR